MYIHIYTYVYTYTCIYLYTYIQIHKYKFTHTRKFLHLCIYINTYIHTYIQENEEGGVSCLRRQLSDYWSSLKGHVNRMFLHVMDPHTHPLSLEFLSQDGHGHQHSQRRPTSPCNLYLCVSYTHSSMRVGGQGGAELSVYIYIDTYICIGGLPMCIRFICTYVHIYMCIYVNIYICTYVYQYMYIYVYVYTHICITVIHI